MDLNPEKLKNLIAEAIKHRTHPPQEKVRAKYCFWIDRKTKHIGVNWAPLFHPVLGMDVVYTIMRDLDEGFTAEEWDELAEKFMPYFLEEKTCKTS
jgi:hypothetical protein